MSFLNGEENVYNEILKMEFISDVSDEPLQKQLSQRTFAVSFDLDSDDEDSNEMAATAIDYIEDEIYDLGYEVDWISNDRFQLEKC